MPNFWLDSSMFIEAKNGNYGFDIAPGFWSALDDAAASGQIASSSLVYDEVLGHSDDELAAWAKARKDGPLWVTPSKAVQDAYTVIAQYVAATYPPIEVGKSFKGADLWVIAHALVDGGRVVCKESLVNPNSKKAKIPNVCHHFQIKPANTSDMLRSLGVKLKYGQP